jgi:translation elongation factor EF-Ts
VDFDLETPALAQAGAFAEFARNLSMHISAANPDSVQALLEQPYVFEPSVTVHAALRAVSDKVHGDIAVTRFVRWDNGRG